MTLEVLKCPPHSLHPVASLTLSMRRITKEVSSLSSSLPLSYHSSICVRVDDARPDVISVLIIGPEDTPYANGCFLFDIFLDTDVRMGWCKVVGELSQVGIFS